MTSPRYDLVHDVVHWLLRKGMISSDHVERAENERQSALHQGRWEDLSEILVRNGAISRDALEQATKSLTLFVGCHPVPLPPECTLLILILETAIKSSSTSLRFRTDRITYEVDGVWYEMETLSKPLLKMVLSLLAAVTDDGLLRVRQEDRLVDIQVPPFEAREDADVCLKFRYAS